MSKRIDYSCPDCGGDNLGFRVYAQWDVDDQCFVAQGQGSDKTDCWCCDCEEKEDHEHHIWPNIIEIEDEE